MIPFPHILEPAAAAAAQDVIRASVDLAKATLAHEASWGTGDEKIVNSSFRARTAAERRLLLLITKDATALAGVDLPGVAA